MHVHQLSGHSVMHLVLSPELFSASRHTRASKGLILAPVTDIQDVISLLLAPMQEHHVSEELELNATVIAFMNLLCPARVRLLVCDGCRMPSGA
jgi:hypothetical protein